MPARVLLSLVTIWLGVGKSGSLTKTWIGENSWSDGANWIPGLPGTCDTALLAGSQVVRIVGHSTINEIDFSGDASVVFDSFSEITLPNSKECEDKVRRVGVFEARRSNFLLVDNWKVNNEMSGVDVLDVNRIPCKHDIIELPFGELRSEIQSPVEVGSVRIGGRELSVQDVEAWLNSKEGRSELRLLASFQISGVTYCPSRGGCECGNTATCNTTACHNTCKNPVDVPAMCCPVCGAVLEMPINASKSYRQLQLEVSTILSHSQVPHTVHMGIYQGVLNIVIPDHGRYVSFIKEVSHSIKQHLERINYSSDITLRYSRDPLNAVTDKISDDKSSDASSLLVPVLSVLFLILILLGAILLCVWRFRPKNFKLFRNNDAVCNTYDTLTLDHVYESIHDRVSFRSSLPNSSHEGKPSAEFCSVPSAEFYSVPSSADGVEVQDISFKEADCSPNPHQPTGLSVI